ncbi:hypothetical protein ACFO8O_13775 [Hephaestia sp. GCM10023244]|uniref:hypothetical protein n=1 Tax=unclassified Hephaestia TaxID=2631281 RepID=UPI0020772150|nr:hypothetical protein [Hephaestia sp. MAHUQ-44]MCM8732030.1 hypothetical protein [Hephaestia sp. MAHUQ-44]
MAYLNFSDPHDAMLASRGIAPVADDVPARLSPLEWSVVALAQKEKLSSIGRPGRVATAMGKLFGTRRNPALADGRLEALRRLAVIAWHRGYAIHSSEIQAFKRAGFSMPQYELVLASISRGRDLVNRQGR